MRVKRNFAVLIAIACAIPVAACNASKKEPVADKKGMEVTAQSIVGPLQRFPDGSPVVIAGGSIDAVLKKNFPKNVDPGQWTLSTNQTGCATPVEKNCRYVTTKPIDTTLLEVSDAGSLLATFPSLKAWQAQVFPSDGTVSGSVPDPKHWEPDYDVLLCASTDRTSCSGTSKTGYVLALVEGRKNKGEAIGFTAGAMTVTFHNTTNHNKKHKEDMSHIVVVYTDGRGVSHTYTDDCAEFSGSYCNVGVGVP